MSHMPGAFVDAWFCTFAEIFVVKDQPNSVYLHNTCIVFLLWEMKVDSWHCRCPTILYTRPILTFLYPFKLAKFYY